MTHGFRIQTSKLVHFWTFYYEIPEWYVSMPTSSEIIMYARGSAISADLDNSEQRAVENALIKLAQQLNNRINRKVNIMAKEAGVDGDLVLKRETERITSIVIKDASIKGYKIYKTKMVNKLGGGGGRGGGKALVAGLKKELFLRRP